MMPLQHQDAHRNSEAAIAASRECQDSHERDLFESALVGIMCCYLDAETMEHCIEGARGYQKRKVAS